MINLTLEWTFENCIKFTKSDYSNCGSKNDKCQKARATKRMKKEDLRQTKDESSASSEPRRRIIMHFK